MKKHQEAIERFRKEIGTHTHGLPDGYENWDNFYTAIEAFLIRELTLAEERGQG